MNVLPPGGGSYSFRRLVAATGIEVRLLNRRIEFVYFDLGNILLSFDPRIVCRNVAGLFAAAADQGRKAVYDSGLEAEFEHGRITSAEFAGQVRDYFGAGATAVSDEQILEAVSNMFTPIRDMEGVLQAVRDAGCGVGLLSNTCAAHWQWVQNQQFQVLNFDFDATILSFEVGSMKPQRRIYEAAEQACGTGVEQILFLDDRLENIEAATSFGWHARQCLGGDPAIGVLREFGLAEPSS